jgi:hypothetical protein
VKACGNPSRRHAVGKVVEQRPPHPSPVPSRSARDVLPLRKAAPAPRAPWRPALRGKSGPHGVRAPPPRHRTTAPPTNR